MSTRHHHSLKTAARTLPPSPRITKLSAALFTASILLASLIGAPSWGQTASRDQEIEQALIRILEQRPELITTAFARAQQREQETRMTVLQEAMRQTMPDILKANFLPSEGPANGRVVVSFFDYNCGFCKQFENQTKQPLIEQRRDIRIIYVHAPILSPGSSRLAEIAIAAHEQKQFLPVHKWLMQQTQPTSSVEDADRLIPTIVQTFRLDERKLRDSLATGRARTELAKHQEIGRKSRIEGTPLIYAGGQAIPGAIPLDPLLAVLEQQSAGR